jgi:glycogen synthase
MKILIISNLFPPEVLGGYEILCRQVCLQLIQEGHQVTVLTTPSKERDRNDWVVRELRLFLPFGQTASGRYRIRQALCYKHNRAVTRRLVADLQPDLVFIWSQRRLTLACARTCQELGLRVAYTFNDEYMEFYKQAPLTGKLSVKGLDLSHSTCISQKLKNNLLECGLPVEQSRVIYQGIPLENFPLRAARANRAEKLLYVGQLHPYKGVHTAIRAAHLCSADLTIVGGGDAAYEAELRGLAADGPARVTFAGKQSPDRVAGFYREHDVLLFTSEWEEPFGLTHLEAMASGIPVISTTNGGQGEFLRNGENCLAFKPGDSLGLAARVVQLRQNTGLAQELSEAGRKTVETSFTLTAYNQSLLRFLEEVA